MVSKINNRSKLCIISLELFIALLQHKEDRQFSPIVQSAETQYSDIVILFGTLIVTIFACYLILFDLFLMSNVKDISNFMFSTIFSFVDCNILLSLCLVLYQVCSFPWQYPISLTSPTSLTPSKLHLHSFRQQPLWASMQGTSPSHTP